MPKFRKPHRLEQGMTIGVIAPASAVRDERLQKGLDRISGRGYIVRTGDHLYTRHGYFAATDEMRALDLMQMIRDPSVHAIICARGGYGSWRLLPHLDFGEVKKHPKLFIGYSDITTLHLAFERHAALATIHGPTVTTLGGPMSDDSESCFWNLLECTDAYGAYPASTSVRMLSGGKSSGRLAGGCLSLLAASAGTPEQPDFHDRIVVIEDVNENVPHVDRHVSQLIRAGAFDGVAGIVIGTVTGWDKDLKGPATITLDDIWRDRLLPLGIPIIVGFPCGHEPDPLTIPLGCLAELDADSGRLTLLEAAVV